MRPLHAQVAGEGPTLVLIHGWGLNHAVWSGVLPSLARHHRVVALDLPGYGQSPFDANGHSLAQLAEAVAATAGPAAIWLGWSLGGQVALAGAMAGLTAKLVLVGTTPRFVATPDWPHATPATLLAGLAKALTSDYEGTLLRFLALQARGSSAGREEIRTLREWLFAHGRPQPEALAAGLRLLEEGDLRAQLPQLTLPTLVIHGERDRLAPPEAARALVETLPQAELRLVAGAGHAPFLSHPEQFVAAVEAFVGGSPSTP